MKNGVDEIESIPCQNQYGLLLRGTISKTESTLHWPSGKKREVVSIKG